MHTVAYFVEANFVQKFEIITTKISKEEFCFVDKVYVASITLNNIWQIGSAMYWS
jgi:hypothetical protein